jgi:hypothetical protein
LLTCKLHLFKWSHHSQIIVEILVIIVDFRQV